MSQNVQSAISISLLSATVSTLLALIFAIPVAYTM
jgi:ABC-type sulfate transport system permease component